MQAADRQRLTSDSLQKSSTAWTRRAPLDHTGCITHANITISTERSGRVSRFWNPRTR